MTGPNAESLKAALDPRKEIEREIEQTERLLDGAPETDTASKAAPDAESRAVAAADEQRVGVYGVKWDDEGAIPGEPPAEGTIFAMGPDRPSNAELERRAAEENAWAKIAWARSEILSLRDQLKGIEQHSEEVKAIKAEMVSILKELLPQAKRNAKRGSPALLRLIARAVRTKL